MIKWNNNCETGQSQGYSGQSKLPDKGRIPLFDLGIPTNRKQVQMLDMWLKNMIKKIEKNMELGHEQKIGKLMTIHNFALLEVNRQVSVQCLERGEFLQKVFDSYIELMKQ